MPLKVVSFATYLTTGETPWRDEDHCASMFVKAIKGRKFNGYGRVPVKEKVMQLVQSNADDAIPWFGEIASEFLGGRLSAGIVLVPIPNSDCVVGSDVVSRTASLAQAIAQHFAGIEVLDCLRWREKMTPSSQGGTRDPQELYEKLVVTRKVAGVKVVLVDDVRTKGSHLVAAKARLTEKGARCVMAVCAGRTVLAPEPAAFAVLEEQLDDLVPSK